MIGRQNKPSTVTKTNDTCKDNDRKVDIWENLCKWDTWEESALGKAFVRDKTTTFWRYA